MLSLFPSLLSWNNLSPFLIRLTLGAVLVIWSYTGIKKSSATPREKAVALIEGLVGILLIIGLWVQAAAVVAAVDLIIRLIRKIQTHAFLTTGVNYYVLLLVLSLSLLVTGAGFWSFDLPL